MLIETCKVGFKMRLQHVNYQWYTMFIPNTLVRVFLENLQECISSCREVVTLQKTWSSMKFTKLGSPEHFNISLHFRTCMTHSWCKAWWTIHTFNEIHGWLKTLVQLMSNCAVFSADWNLCQHCRGWRRRCVCCPFQPSAWSLWV